MHKKQAKGLLFFKFVYSSTAKPMATPARTAPSFPKLTRTLLAAPFLLAEGAADEPVVVAEHRPEPANWVVGRYTIALPCVIGTLSLPSLVIVMVVQLRASVRLVPGAQAFSLVTGMVKV